MTHEQRDNHIAQLLSYRSYLRCQLAHVDEEIAELTSRNAVEASTKTPHDPVAVALLDQRRDARRRPEGELLAVMLDGVDVDWKAIEFGSGDDLR